MARQHCVLAGVPFDESRVTARLQSNEHIRQSLPWAKSAWLVRAGDSHVRLDPDGALLTITDYGREKRILARTELPQSYQISTVSQAETAGIRSLDRLLILRTGLEIESCEMWDWNPQKPNPSTKGRCNITFSHRPFGYRTRGYGNCVILELDRLDGGLLRLSVRKGWTYDPPRNLMGALDAAAIARQIVTSRAETMPPSLRRRVLRALPSASAWSANANLLYLGANDGWNSTEWRALSGERRVRLCFEFTTPNLTIQIDAENGKCLGGGVLQGATSSQRKVNLPKGVKKPPIDSPADNSANSLPTRGAEQIGAWLLGLGGAMVATMLAIRHFGSRAKN